MKNSMFLWVLAIMSVMAVGVLAGHFSAKRAVQNLDYPIAIIDMAKFIDAAITDKDGNIDPEKVDEGMKTARLAAKSLADQGFVVIEKQSVLAAPEHYYMKINSQK